jgi:hypothetical protein
MWQPGTRVLATRLDDDYWYPGTVQLADGPRCLVLFDDGEEVWLPDDQVLPLRIDVGDRVFVRVPGGGSYAPCFVVRRDGEKINVQFDDGTDEQTSLGMVRVDPTQWKDPGGAAPAPRWIVGDRVLCKWSRDAYWYPGTIQAIDGERLHVYFDDGDNEWTTTDKVIPIDLAVGTRVFARFQRGPAYLPARIARVSGERLTLDYDDGRTEETTVGFVRVRRGPVANPWKTGQRVLANWPPEPQFYYPAVVHAVDGDVVHVHYDDGDQARLAVEAVLPLRLEVGHHVYARRQQGQYYFPAVIQTRNGEEILLRYDDDGGTEWSLIRMVRVVPTEIPGLLH